MVEFEHLNDGWNADPNAPCPQVCVDERDVMLRFLASSRGEKTLRFRNVARFRFTAVNDEGWYRGRCRFSSLAPSWGEFFRVSGDTSDGRYYAPWKVLRGSTELDIHYLFYFRDETFECLADGFDDVTHAHFAVEFKDPEVFLNAAQQIEVLTARPFKAVIEDAFPIKGRGVALTLTGVEGMPKTDCVVRFGGMRARILDVGKNSTDGQPVSFRDCLTGRPCAPYGSILVDLEPDGNWQKLFRVQIEEEPNA